MKSKQFQINVNSLTPTIHEISLDPKVNFILQFIRFVNSGYKKTLFPKWFYKRLSMTFGFIAQYRQWSFYEYHFSEPERIERFLDRVRGYGCYGQPGYTYCDAEREIQRYLKEQEI